MTRCCPAGESATIGKGRANGSQYRDAGLRICRTGSDNGAIYRAPVTHRRLPSANRSVPGCLLEPRLRRRVSIRRHDGGALGERLAARAGELIVSAPEVVEKREGKGAKEDGREPEAAHGGSAGVREAALWAALGIARVGVLAASANHFARRYHGMRKERNAAAGQSHADHPGRRLGLPGCGR